VKTPRGICVESVEVVGFVLLEYEYGIQSDI
jgi:hypothetical protein